MNRTTRNRTLLAICLAGALGATAFAASAQSVTTDAQARTDTAQANAAAQATADVKADPKPRVNCLKDTGTHIRARDPKTGKPLCIGPGRSYSRDDIDRTGQTDLADALRQLDPSVR